MKRILCLWLPHWPVQRLLLAQPQLRSQALVLHEPQRGGLKVVACNQRAAERGIFPGMSVAEAAAVAGKVKLQLIAYDPLADRLALEQLAAWCKRFSPTVAVEDAHPAESLLLEIAGLERLFGDEAALAAQVVHAFRKRGLRLRAAVADTLGAAWGVAHFGEDDAPADRPPTSRTEVVAPGQTAAQLDALPVAALRLSPDVVALLGELGVRRIGQLRALPRRELLSRFGAQVTRRLDQTLGDAAEVIPIYRPPPEFIAEHLLDDPVERREGAALVLEQLLERVAAALAARQQGASAFSPNCVFT